MIEKLRLMRRDVLIKSKNKNEFLRTDNLIYVPEDKKEDKIQFYEVLIISDKVTMFKVGDIILLEWGEHTLPMEWNGIRCAVTSEDDILAVLEK